MLVPTKERPAPENGRDTRMECATATRREPNRTKTARNGTNAWNNLGGRTEGPAKLKAKASAAVCERYTDTLPSIWLLPLITAISLIAFERPLIRLGHRLSNAITRRGQFSPVPSINREALGLQRSCAF